jgi:hypothetical protein
VVSLDDDDYADYPERWIEAAGEFLWILPVDAPLALVANALHRLAEAGYLVSPARHSAVCGALTEQLRQCEAAADELYERLYREGLEY